MSDGNGKSATPILEVRDVEKRFGATLALDSISLTLNKGEILALLGDNGAGKSTLIKILSGVYKADSGKMLVEGEETVFASPRRTVIEMTDRAMTDQNCFTRLRTSISVSVVAISALPSLSCG